MRIVLPAIAASLALALAAGSVVAQDGDGQPIVSTSPGALDEPETWNCQRIEPEYSDWLRRGNSPKSWKFAGKTYRDAASDRLYTWQNWLDWAQEAGCFAGGQTTPSTPSTSVLIGGAVAAFGAALIGVQSGSGPKSPG